MIEVLRLRGLHLQGRGCGEVTCIWDPLPGTLIRDSYISIGKRFPFAMWL